MQTRSDRQLAYRWIRATGAGWLLGIPLIIGFALAGEAVGIGGSQVLVGAGMGTGVGLAQGRLAREFTGRAAPWVWSSAVGLALPFLFADVAIAAGWHFDYSLQRSVALGGFAVGAWQAIILHPRFRLAGTWLIASALGWTLAGTTAALADSWRLLGSIRGLAGALAYLGAIAGGGLVLGLVTGLALAALRPREPPCRRWHPAARPHDDRGIHGPTPRDSL